MLQQATGAGAQAQAWLEVVSNPRPVRRRRSNSCPAGGTVKELRGAHAPLRDQKTQHQSLAAEVHRPINTAINSEKHCFYQQAAEGLSQQGSPCTRQMVRHPTENADPRMWKSWRDRGFPVWTTKPARSKALIALRTSRSAAIYQRRAIPTKTYQRR